MSDDDVFRYRVTLVPLQGIGSFRMQSEFAVRADVVLMSDEYELVRLLTEKVSRELLGRDWGALRCQRVERQEMGGVWRERRWPIPHLSAHWIPGKDEDPVSQLEFAPSGALLTNLIPTWPQ